MENLGYSDESEETKNELRDRFQKDGYFMAFHHVTDDMPNQLTWPDGTRSVALGLEFSGISQYIENPETSEFGTEVHIGYSFFYDPKRLEVKVLTDGISTKEDVELTEEKLEQEGWRTLSTFLMQAVGYREKNLAPGGC